MISGSSVVPGAEGFGELAADIFRSSQSLIVRFHFSILRVNSSTVKLNAGMTSAHDLNNGIAKKLINPVWDCANASIFPIIGADTSEEGIPRSISIEACLENSSIRIVAHCAAQSCPRA